MGQSLLREEEIFRIAREIPSPDARQGYLNQVCGDNTKLHERVVALLKATDDDSFLENPPPAVQATAKIRAISEESGDATWQLQATTADRRRRFRRCLHGRTAAAGTPAKLR